MRFIIHNSLLPRTVTMKAVIYDSPHTVKVVDKDIPKAGPGEAVVKVRRRDILFRR